MSNDNIPKKNENSETNIGFKDTIIGFIKPDEPEVEPQEAIENYYDKKVKEIEEQEELEEDELKKKKKKKEREELEEQKRVLLQSTLVTIPAIEKEFEKMAKELPGSKNKSKEKFKKEQNIEKDSKQIIHDEQKSNQSKNEIEKEER